MFPYSPSSLAARALPHREIPAPRHEKCEKCGLSLTIDEGKKMVAAVKDSGVVFQAGSQQRADNFFRKAREIASNG
jgi:predicted dehydrogenase